MDASETPQYPPAPVFPVDPASPLVPGCAPPFPSVPLEQRDHFAFPFTVNASSAQSFNARTFNVTSSHVDATAPCFPAFVPSSNNGTVH